MGSNTSKKRSNKNKNRSERLKYTDEEDKELDELEKIIADSKKDDVKENEEISKDNGGNEDEEDFFASLDKQEEIKTFSHRKEKENDKKFENNKLVKFVKGNTKYAIWGSIVAVLFIALIVALAVDAGNKGSNSVGDNKNKTENVLKENTNKEIDSLVNKYFSAIVACDVDKLSEIMDSTINISPEQLKKESEYIEEYKNIKCYTKKGIKNGEFVVYVYYENKILNIDTLAPGAVILYVKKDEEKGVYRIHNGISDTEISNYISKLSENKDIIKFNNDVDDKFKKAYEKDAALKAFYDALISASQVHEGESIQQETQPQETPVPEEQPQETPVPEEQPQETPAPEEQPQETPAP